MAQPVILRFLGDTSDLEAAFKRAAASSGAFEGLIKKMDALGDASIRAGRSLTRSITIPVVAAGAGAVTLALKFDQAMNRIGALTDIGAKGVAGLSQQVLDLAKTVPIGPVKLAQGLYYLESAGLSSKVAMDALKASAKGSAAGLGDFAQLSDVVSGVLKGWPSIIGGATGAVDILIKTVKAGKLEPDALAKELGKVLAPAAAVGVQFKEVGAALAAMSNKNLNAEASTTALRQIFVELQKPTKASAAAMKDVGTSADEVRSTLKEKGLLAALDLLNKGVGDNSEKWFKLFPNVRAATGVMALMGKNTKDTEGIFKQFNSTTGELSAAFDTMSKDPMFRLQLAWSRIQVAAIKAGNIIVPWVVKIADKVSELADKFSKLDQKTQDTIVKFLGIAAAVGPSLYAFGKLTKVFTTLAQNPLLGFLLLLAGALTLAYTHSKQFRDAVNGIAEKLKNWGLETLLPKLKGFVDDIKKIADSPEAARVLKDIKGAFKDIADHAAPVVGAFKDLWEKFDKIDKVQVARDTLKGIADVIENPAFQVALGAASGAVAGWLAYSAAVKGAAAAMAVFDVFMGIADIEIAPFLLVALAVGAVAGALYLAYLKFKPVKDFFNELGREAKVLGGDLKTLWGWIETGAVAVYNFGKKVEYYTSFDYLSKGIYAFFHAIPGWATTAWNWVKQKATDAWTWVSQKATAAWNWVTQKGSDAINAIKGFFDSLPQKASQAWDAMKKKISDKWNEIKNAAVNFFKSAPGWLLQAGKDMIQGFINGMGSMISGVTTAAANLAKSAVDAVTSHLKINSPSKVMIPIGSSVGEGLALGISNSTLGVTKAATDQMKKLLATYQAKQKELATAQRKMVNDQSTLRAANDKLHGDLHPKGKHAKVDKDLVARDREAILRDKLRIDGDKKSISADKAAVAAAKAAYDAEVRYQKALNDRRRAGASMLATAQKMYADFSAKTATQFSSPMAKAADSMAANLRTQFADRDGNLPKAVEDTVNNLKGMADQIDQAFKGVVDSLNGQTSLTSKFTDSATVGDMAAYLTSRVDDLKAFNQDLRFLAVRGTPKGLLAEFIKGGLSALPVVESLANSSDSDFASILSLQSQVDQLTGNIAKTSEDITFGNGVSGASGPYVRAPKPTPPPTAPDQPAVVVNVATDADPTQIGQEVAWAVKGAG